MSHALATRGGFAGWRALSRAAPLSAVGFAAWELSNWHRLVAKEQSEGMMPTADDGVVVDAS